MRKHDDSKSARPGGRAEPGSLANRAAGAEPEATAGNGVDILHLAELVAVVRQRLALDNSFPDDAILASLKLIAGKSSARGRYEAAFGSNLGQHLCRHPGNGGSDPGQALTALVGLLPAPRS